MANRIAVVGKTKSGKSSSLRNLDAKKTYVIKVLQKDLPFRGSRSKYSAEHKNVFHTTDYGQVCAILKKINEDRKEINTVVLDDIGHLMVREAFDRSSESGLAA